jgi:hypothetical protein
MLRNVIAVFCTLSNLSLVPMFFWAVMPCGLLGRHQRFGGKYLSTSSPSYRNSMFPRNICTCQCSPEAHTDVRNVGACLQISTASRPRTRTALSPVCFRRSTHHAVSGRGCFLFCSVHRTVTPAPLFANIKASEVSSEQCISIWVELPVKTSDRRFSLFSCCTRHATYWLQRPSVPSLQEGLITGNSTEDIINQENRRQGFKNCIIIII